MDVVVRIDGKGYGTRGCSEIAAFGGLEGHEFQGRVRYESGAGERALTSQNKGASQGSKTTEEPGLQIRRGRIFSALPPGVEF